MNYEGNGKWSVFEKRCLIVEAKLIETAAWLAHQIVTIEYEEHGYAYACAHKMKRPAG